MDAKAGINLHSGRTDKSGGLRVAVAEGRAELERLREQWTALASNAVEPNIFLEPFQVLPALDAFGSGKELSFLCVFGPDTGNTDRERLVGFVVFERRRSFRGWPVDILCVWQNPHLFLSTPLIHKNAPREVWKAIFEWCRSSPRGATLLEFPSLLAEGPSYEALVDALWEEALLSHSVEHYTRALLLVSDQDAQRSRMEQLSGSRRSQMRRKLKRLGELGRVEFKVLQADGDVGRWVSDLLELEARGWKGKEGTAMLCRSEDASYFRAICQSAFAAGRLHMPALFLNDRPIAMKCNFLCNNGVFWLKVAYDEELGKFSPGMLLEAENVEDVSRMRGIQWMDSCTAPKSYCDELWGDRRSIQHLLIETGKRRGKLCLGLFALLRSLKRSSAKRTS